MSATPPPQDPSGPPTALGDLAIRLVTTVALPALAAGYTRLVRTLRAHPGLQRLAREQGAAALLALESDALDGLKKGNRELVTAAERAAEDAMTRAVRARYPDHAVVGEEHGYTPGSRVRWVFDPVDGTSAMIRTAMAAAYGVPPGRPAPAFGTTVAVVDGDAAVLGVVLELRPAAGTLVAGDCWVGERGRVTTANGVAVDPPPAPATLAAATLASTVPEVMFATAAAWSGFQALAEATRGCAVDQNCVGYVRLLQPGGGIDVVYEADLAYHDAVALVPVLHGAGVVASDGAGAPLRFPEASIPREFSVLAAQPALHALALARVRAGVAPEANRFARGEDVHQGYARKFGPGPA